MMKTPGKLILGLGLTAAAAAVAMTPAVKNMVNNKMNNSQYQANNLNKYS